MSVNTYTPDSTKIIHNTSVDFVTRYINKPVHLVQYDNSNPIIAVKLYSNGTPYAVPEGMDVNVRVKKPDGTIIYNPVLGCDSTRTIVYVEVTAQMCVVYGALYPILEVRRSTTVAASGYIYVEVDKNPVTYADIESSSEAKTVEEYVGLAESWARGGTGARPDEDTNNSKYFAEKSGLHEAQAQVYANDSKLSSDNASESEINAKASELAANTAERAADQAVLDAIAEVVKATSEANRSEASSVEAESYTHGGTGTRPGEDTDNAQYYYEHAKQIVGIDIATVDTAGIVKPDGTTIKVQPDGTISVEDISSLDDSEVDDIFNEVWK